MTSKQQKQTSAVSKVTRKGQVTIPSFFRRKYNIQEGTKVEMIEEGSRLILEPVPDLNDLIGIDKGKYDPSTLKRMLDRSRKKWR